MATSPHLGRSRPSNGRIALAIAVMAVAAAGAVAALVTGIGTLGKDTIRCAIPGRNELRLDSPGGYTVFYEHRSDFDGKQYDTGRAWPGYTVELTDANGTPVSLLPWHGSRYSFAGKTGYAIHTFDIDAPGTYVLSAGVPVKPGQTEVVLSLKRGFGARMLVVILVPLGVVFAGVAVMLAVLGLFPGRGRANGHGLVETNGDGVLLDTSRGFFEGSWRMPLAYEGSLCDRYFGGRVGGRIQCNARLTLTEDAIHIVPWFGDPVTIPLDRVYDTYPCSTTGGKIWARDRVLKIVWQSDEGVAATGVVTMLGAGTNARDWSDAIAPLLSGLPAPDADAVESVRRVNRRVTRIFWGVALSPVLLEVAAFAGWVPISMGLLTNAFLPSFLIAALVARAYYRRHARAVDTIRG